MGFAPTHRAVRATAFLLLLGPGLAGLNAQTSRGTISGLVKDPSSAAIAGAEVEIVNEQTGVSRSTTTNEAGLYRFDAVDLGGYTVVAKTTGFQTFSARNIPVTAAQVVTVDVQLEVGDVATTIEVVAETGAVLQYEAPVRGGSIGQQQMTQLPYSTRNPVTLTFLLPGVTTNRFAFGTGGLMGRFAINGARGRSNNFMIDGSENNDISIAGQGFQITNPDFVGEVNVQTSNYDAEFGRAGGATINVITKGGTNEFHGTAHFLLDVTNDDAITSTLAGDPEIQRRRRLPQGTEQYWGGTIGGPIVKNKTFFFTGYQRNRQFATGSSQLFAPTEAGWQTLNGLFPQGSNLNVDRYRQSVGNVRGVFNLSNEALGNGRPDVQFGAAVGSYAQTFTDDQLTTRIDHRLGDRDLLYGRYLISNSTVPKQVSGGTFFPGWGVSQANRTQSAGISETHIFSPALTNELRLSYNRLAFNFLDDADNPLALEMPRYAIAGQPTSFGLEALFPQGRTANNYSLQNTMSYNRGAHMMRFGTDLLYQRSGQFAPAAFRGQLTYNAAGGFGGFANFVDDFGGSAQGGGNAVRDFGSARYYPNLFRQAYFFQDRWRATGSLAISLGVRYEYFGLPMNSILKPAFSGLFNVDPVTFTGPYSEPNRVEPDYNNFAPSVGITWSPDAGSGVMGWLLGQKKTVIRTGYQIGYDSFFNNITSNAQASTPNLVATGVPSVVSAANPRGTPTLSQLLPTQPRDPQPIDGQTLTLRELRNPYYQRWSFGIQRELSGRIIADISYVGTSGTRLYLNEDFNPVVPAALRVIPQTDPPIPASRLQPRYDALQGARTIRTNGGSSIYHAFQASMQRRFAQGFTMQAAYTWSKNIDNASEIFAPAGINASSLAAVPAIFGGQAAERGVSTLHRDHRFVFGYLYELPVFRTQQGALGRILGGWQLSGMTTFETGVPFNIVNGADADGIGGASDRPMFNPNGQRNIRAVPNAASPTGYVNPDASGGAAPIDPAQAMFIGIPANSGFTGNLGRNTARTPGINSWDANLQKAVKIQEAWQLQFRVEAFNVFNKPNYGWPSVSPFAPGPGTFPAAVMTSAPGLFLTNSLADGGGRVLRYQLKLLF